MSKYNSSIDVLIYVVAAALVVVFSVGVVMGLRDHGISSCEDRGGTPVVSSWFSENNWDVRCIHD